MCVRAVRARLCWVQLIVFYASGLHCGRVAAHARLPVLCAWCCHHQLACPAPSCCCVDVLH